MGKAAYQGITRPGSTIFPKAQYKISKCSKDRALDGMDVVDGPSDFNESSDEQSVVGLAQKLAAERDGSEATKIA